MKITKSFMIQPNKLYPTESLFSIVSDKIEKFMDIMKKEGGEDTEIFVFEFDKEYYIIEGHHQMLAANLLRLSQIKVHEVDCQDLSFFKDSENIIGTLKSIGKTTLYDFEAIGDFKYKNYPKYYF